MAERILETVVRCNIGIYIYCLLYLYGMVTYCNFFLTSSAYVEKVIGMLFYFTLFFLWYFYK